MPVSIFGALKMMVVTNLHIVKTGDGYDLRDPKNSRFVMVVTAETVTELIEKEWISPLDDAGEIYLATAEGRRFMKRFQNL